MESASFSFSFFFSIRRLKAPLNGIELSRTAAAVCALVLVLFFAISFYIPISHSELPLRIGPEKTGELCFASKPRLDSSRKAKRDYIRVEMETGLPV